jgi:hypothetical protein
MFFIIAFSPFVLLRNKAPLTTSHIFWLDSNRKKWVELLKDYRFAGGTEYKDRLAEQRKIKALFRKHQYSRLVHDLLRLTDHKKRTITQIMSIFYIYSCRSCFPLLPEPSIQYASLTGH